MSTIDKLVIPVGADVKPLARDLTAAEGKFTGFAATASAPVPLSLNLGPLKTDLDKAKEMAGKASKALTVNYLAGRVAPALSKSTNALQIGKAAIDAGQSKAADLTIRVGVAALKADLAASTAVVKSAMKAMVKVAFLPITVGSIAIQVGMALAQALILKKIKDITGMSTINLLLTYAAVRVGLTIVQRLVAAGVRSMAAVAVVPFRIALGALRAGLRTARALVVSGVHQIAAVAAIPLKLAGQGLSMSLAGGVLGGLVGIPAILGGSILAASDLNETVSKVGYTFGKSADLVTKGADVMASRFGTVKTTFMDAASGIGLVGKAAGQTDAQSARMGVSLAKIAADASSFYNIPLDEALEKIRSGLVGEAEPLRALGVLLSEDAVKAQAMRMGLSSVKGELSEGQKVMARAALITAGLAVAQGDLARTADSLANRMREVWGRIQNVAATMGQFLLPAAQSLAAAFSDLGKIAGDVVERNKATLTAWGESIRKAADWVGIVVRNFADLKRIGILALGDVGKHLWDSIKTAFDNGVKFAVYFAERLGFEIEKSVTKALHAASPRWFGAWADREAPKAPNAAPAPVLTWNPAIAKGLEAILASDKLKSIGPMALDIAGQVSHFAGMAQQASQWMVKGSAVVEQRKLDALQAGSKARGRLDGDRTPPRPPPSPAAVLAKTNAALKASDLFGTLLGPGGAIGGAATAYAEALKKSQEREVPKGRPKGKADPGAPQSKLKALPPELVAGLQAATLGGALGGFGGGAHLVPVVASAMAAKKTEEMATPKFAELADFNSREAYSSIIRNGSSGGRDNGIKTVAREAPKQTGLLNKLVVAAEKKVSSTSLEVFSFG